MSLRKGNGRNGKKFRSVGEEERAGIGNYKGSQRASPRSQSDLVKSAYLLILSSSRKRLFKVVDPACGTTSSVSFTKLHFHLKIGTVIERLGIRSNITRRSFVFLCHGNIIFSAGRPNPTFSFSLCCQPFIKRA